MKILELFAGSRSFSKVAQAMGHQTFTSDINPLDGIDYVCDILDFDVNKTPFRPDVIWASPDCATWSKAAGNLHYNKGCDEPKTERAKAARKHVYRTFQIISYFRTINPNLVWIIENPVGRMKNFIRDFDEDVSVITVDQCQYGRKFQKATHLFTNMTGFIPKRCPGRKNGCDHLPNVKDTGQGKLGDILPKGYYNRAMIAPELCKEIINTIERNQ